MRRFSLFVLLALAAIAPAIVVRMGGWHSTPLVDTAVFGVAVLAAGFMLSWGAEAAELHFSQGLILAGVALITVLPEYAVDMYYAFQAGRAPHSNYVHYAAANMTGANRLLVGVGWPTMMLLHWWRTRERAILLVEANSVEVGFLFIASLYAFVILSKNRIDLFDFLLLGIVFGAYLWQVGRIPKEESAEKEEEEPGPAGALAKLSPFAQWAWIAGLAVIACTSILISAEPFAEAIVASGRLLGIDEFLLIQWLAPLASEAPAISIAILFVLSGHSAAGLTAMISDKINQWTLLVGMLPLAMSLGASSIIALPLDARQHEEFFLTAAQSLFALSLLLRLRFSLWSALVVLGLFLVQVIIAFAFRNNEARVVSSLTILGWVYMAISIPFFLTGLPSWLKAARSTFGARGRSGLAVGENKKI